MIPSLDPDEHPLEALIERNLPMLRAFLGNRLGPVINGQESASDLAQSVCREILQDQDQYEFRGEGAFRSWLFEVARRKMVDRHRYYTRAKRDVQRTDRVNDGDVAMPDRRRPTPSEDASLREQTRRLWETLDQLDEEDRQVIVLFHVFGMSHAEMAEQQGITLDASRGSLSRALARLSRVLRRQPG